MDPLCVFSVLCLLCLCVRLFICALLSPDGKGLTSRLSFVVSNCEFVTLRTLFGDCVGVPRSLRTRHIWHTRRTQFYAPTLASKKEFGLYPALILRLSALSKGVGH